MPLWRKEKADPWGDLESLGYAELVGVVLRQAVLDIARASVNIEAAELRGLLGASSNARGQRVAGIELVQRILACPACAEASPEDVEAYATAIRSGMTEGPYDLELTGIAAPDLQRRTTAPVVLVAFLGSSLSRSLELCTKLQHNIGAQRVLDRVSLNDAVSLKEILEAFGFSVRVREESPSATAGNRPSREPIPADVRREVWRRDGGQCVDCGSRERLEYDHIIPLSKGGSNTARNLELRCESCNRRKAASI